MLLWRCPAWVCLWTPCSYLKASSERTSDNLQPTEGDDLVDTFICNCTDCRKITASMFASNFIVNDSALKHLKGQDKLTKFSQNNTIETGNCMSNYFCSVCGKYSCIRSRIALETMIAGKHGPFISSSSQSSFVLTTVGTLMYRISTGSPGKSILRIGTVDDFSLHETKLKPRIEQFGKDRVSWLKGGEGVKQKMGNFYDSRKM